MLLAVNDTCRALIEPPDSVKALIEGVMLAVTSRPLAPNASAPLRPKPCA